MSEPISLQLGSRPNLAWIPVDKIRVDHNYQREIRPNRVRQILRDFNWSQFQPVMLAEQEDGTYTVFDGQHRVAAAKAHPHINEVPAAVITLNGVKSEAAAFLGVNLNRTAVGSIERYWAGIEAGDVEMIRIRDVLALAGCEVIQAHGMRPSSNKTTAVTAVNRAIKSYGDQAVILAFETLSEAWRNDPNALHGVFIAATARLYRNNKATIQKDRMIARLRTSDRKAMGSAAETFKKIGGGDATLNLAKAIVEIYNKGIYANQIQIGNNSANRKDGRK